MEDGNFAAVKTCYEFGWMDSISGDTFGVHELLGMTDMVQLLARLYNLSQGGDGTIPELPEDLGDCVRFYDTDGNLVCNTFSVMVDFIARERELTVLFYDETELPETLTMEAGFPGDKNTCTASGVWTGYDAENGFARYVFAAPDGVDFRTLDLQEYQEECRYLWNILEVNRREGITDDPNSYDAILYLMFREPRRLPYCFRTMFLYAAIEDTVWRMEFAVPLAAICEGLPDIREASSIPDLPDWRFGAEETEAVLSLYRKGILNGFDEAGTFYGADWLTRGQAARIADRVLTAFQEADKL